MALPRRLLFTISRRARFSPPLSRVLGATPHIYSRRFSAEAVSDPLNRVQAYISRTTDPYLNLTIEHFLLQKTPADSTVLFLYTNRPCVVIGRNQNPWVEVNLGLLNRRGVLRGETDGDAGVDAEKDDDDDSSVILVRRRSGGGAVFHDSGNVNYSVICPPAAFDRDKHAEMVVRALRNLGVSTARVNGRHDIVLSSPAPPSPSPSPPPIKGDSAAAAPTTFKISGSAYKLTRSRALHHGTCLLSSPHIARIGRFLASPAAPYIKARGVESVRSPVRNIGRAIPNAAFEAAVVDEFALMYGGGADPDIIGETPELVAREILSVPEIAAGYAELVSPSWLYTQTPQFTLTTHPDDSSPSSPPSSPHSSLPPSSLLPPPPGFNATMTVRHGRIVSVAGALPPSLVDAATALHRVADWRAEVGDEVVGTWFNCLFGVGGGDEDEKKEGKDKGKGKGKGKGVRDEKED